MRIIVLALLAFFLRPLCASGLPEFTAGYEIFYGNIHLGQANYRFSRNGDNSYRFDFSSELRFLIFWDRRVVNSDVVYEDPRLLPGYYSHDRKGTGRDYFEEIRFDRSNSVIHSRFKKETEEFKYENDIVDGLTVQLQLMLDLQRGIERPRYKIIDENRIREREFSFVGEETITIQNQPLRTVIYQVVRNHNRRTTQMWLSPEWNYLPVQMVHYSKGKKRFNAHLVRFEQLGEIDGGMRLKGNQDLKAALD